MTMELRNFNKRKAYIIMHFRSGKGNRILSQVMRDTSIFLAIYLKKSIYVLRLCFFVLD